MTIGDEKVVASAAVAPPSAPVGVEGLRHEAVEALRDAWKLGRQDRFLDSAPLVERIVKAALAQQPPAVDGDWRKKAAGWLESKAVEQDSNNQKWPDHAAAYKEWRDLFDLKRLPPTQNRMARRAGRGRKR